LDIKNYSFHKLPFSDLMKTYTSDFSRVSEFYEFNPFLLSHIKERASTFNFRGDRSASIELLKKINKRYEVHENALDNLERLEDKKALALVTGQQLGVLGGPLYTILKTLSTIHLAKRTEEQLGRPVIPVFWLADEDHDYEEVRSVTVLNGDEPQTFSLPGRHRALPPVAMLKYTSAINELRKEVREVQFDTDFSEDLWTLINQNFYEGNRFDYAFGGFIADLFSRHGLVIAGSNHKKIKEQTRECMIAAIEQADDIKTSLQVQTESIAAKFSQQAAIYDSNLFYLDSSSGRVKITRNGDGWKTESGYEWNTKQLIDDIDTNPYSFSPNVFLRPIMQDRLLPTLGYVAGPGEIGYYGQMKKFYHRFDMQMPVIFPRLSATFIEPAIDRILSEVPFEVHEFSRRIEDLESQFVDRTEQVDIEAIFSAWKDNTRRVSESPIKEIGDIDPTLEAAAEKAETVFSNELDKLKGKVYRSVKSQKETQLNRIRRIQKHIFPNRILQERSVAGIYFMNKYGIDIWDRLLDEMNTSDEDGFSEHKLIYL